MQDGDEHEAVLSPNRKDCSSAASDSGSKTNNETVRVRWKPTAQQISILEHIFNSGTVNPPKDVTSNIRKQLEQFGPVEDVNIFYWFQNRRSRWSRRQRQMCSDYAAAVDPITSSSNFEPSHQSCGGSMFPDTTNHPYMPNHPTGSIRVFINGKATKLPTRPVDMTGMFGQDLILVHPTGLPVNQFGFDLQHGQSYFLVPRPT